MSMNETQLTQLLTIILVILGLVWFYRRCDRKRHEKYGYGSGGGFGAGGPWAGGYNSSYSGWANGPMSN